MRALVAITQLPATSLPTTRPIQAAGDHVPVSGGSITIVAVIAAVSLLALVVGTVLRSQVLRADTGTPGMQRVAAAIQEGASAYLNRQLRTLAIFVLVVFALLFLLPADDGSVRIGRSLFFVVGALFSAFIGYLGMTLAVQANVRVAAAARDGHPRNPYWVTFAMAMVVNTLILTSVAMTMLLPGTVQ